MCRPVPRSYVSQTANSTLRFPSQDRRRMNSRLLTSGLVASLRYPNRSSRRIFPCWISARSRYCTFHEESSPHRHPQTNPKSPMLGHVVGPPVHRTRQSRPIVDIPPVGNVKAHRAEASRAWLLGGDDLACLQIEDRRRRVVRRDQCKEAISLAEGFQSVEHGVVPVVGSHDALAVEDVDVGCLPISRFLSGLDFYREALSGSGPERNLEKSR